MSEAEYEYNVQVQNVAQQAQPACAQVPPVCFQCQFKTLVLIFKGINGSIPSYIRDRILIYEPPQQLCSSGTMQITKLEVKHVITEIPPCLLDQEDPASTRDQANPTVRTALGNTSKTFLLESLFTISKAHSTDTPFHSQTITNALPCHPKYLPMAVF